MSSKIDTIGKWGAKAALASSMEIVNDGDGILIIILQREAGGQDTKTHRSANITNAEAIYMMREREFDMFVDEE